MDYLGTPFAWSVIVVLAIAVAAAMIVYLIPTVRNNDAPDPLFGGVSGMLKQDWARTRQIDFHLPAPESTSPQQLILRVEERKIGKFDGAGGGPAALAARDRGGSQGGCGLLECSQRQSGVTGPARFARLLTTHYSLLTIRYQNHRAISRRSLTRSS